MEPAPPSPEVFPDVFRRQCESRLQAIVALTDDLAQWATARGVPQKVVTSVSLILDELFSNCVLHGYGAHGAGPIDVRAWVDAQAVHVTLTDEAPAFNPLLVPEPDVTLSLEEREVGGLGLLFVRRCADALDYRRLPGQTERNEVRFSKRLQPT